MALKIDMLRGFAAVARTGNLRDAAEILGRTPSAVSMMLSQFEDHLGERLFETDRKNKLTPLGEFVLEQSEAEVQHFDNTVRTITGFANATLGHVRIATVPSVAGTIIPQVMSLRAEAYANVSIELRDMDSRSILHELSRGRVDIGIATKSGNVSGMESLPLLSDRFFVLFDPAHPFAQSDTPVDWGDLQDVRLIANSLSEIINSEASRALHAKSRLMAHNITSIIAMVHAGCGVTLLPEIAVKSVRSSGLLVRPLADTSAKRDIHLLRKADTELSPAARQFEKDILAIVETMSETGLVP
ncbi:LysR family transcriptional regulator [Epibacterium ulvae]|uniref:LysR family transcriptional regulator n=1 Tax=Epibacterium ulvae TaxID=1156985 RepID=UPI001BFCA30F|nr:LysR family transcriptional regulator [Epibacterium ulvae]MBT8155605.1 LysR family transcriptional regulator [Epibacterium ulvae]